MAFGFFKVERARSLEISVETVKQHVQNLLRTLAVNDRTPAAVWALRAGLIEGHRIGFAVSGRVPDLGPVQPDQINGLGFMLSDRKPGEFRLQAGRVKVARAEQ